MMSARHGVNFNILQMEFYQGKAACCHELATKAQAARPPFSRLLALGKQTIIKSSSHQVIRSAESGQKLNADGISFRCGRFGQYLQSRRPNQRHLAAVAHVETRVAR